MKKSMRFWKPTALKALTRKVTVSFGMGGGGGGAGVSSLPEPAPPSSFLNKDEFASKAPPPPPPLLGVPGVEEEADPDSFLKPKTSFFGVDSAEEYTRKCEVVGRRRKCKRRQK